MNPICMIAVMVISASQAQIEGDSASSALNQFALKFLAEISNRLPESMNLAVSPYTVWTAMSMVTEGARGNTAKELEETLHIPPEGPERQRFRVQQSGLVRNIEQKHEGVTLEVLNSIFTRLEATLNPDYLRLVREVFNVQVQPLDFHNSTASARYINKVISDATRGRIPEIVDTASVRDAYMFITSALFFKGLWDKKFDRSDTKQRPFYNEHKQQIGTVSMMQTTGAFPFGQILGGKALAVELPYIGVDMSMVAILPAERVNLTSVLHSMAGTSFSKLVEDLNKTRDYFSAPEIVVALPKFKVSSSLTLNAIFDAMGVKDAFNLAHVNLTGISPTKLFVSRLVHNAEIEVDEDGTIGSAATVVEIADRVSDTDYFNANRPFIFLVYDKKHQTIVFAGRFIDPKEGRHF